jgi:hypothetical protein
VITTSGYNDRGTTPQSVAGAPYLQKPYAMEDLARTLRELLDRLARQYPGRWRSKREDYRLAKSTEAVHDLAVAPAQRATPRPRDPQPPGRVDAAAVANTRVVVCCVVGYWLAALVGGSVTRCFSARPLLFRSRDCRCVSYVRACSWC